MKVIIFIENLMGLNNIQCTHEYVHVIVVQLQLENINTTGIYFFRKQ